MLAITMTQGWMIGIIAFMAVFGICAGVFSAQTSTAGLPFIGMFFLQKQARYGSMDKQEGFAL